jgi:hypothetical protein
MLLAHQEDFSHMHDQAASGIDHAAGLGDHQVGSREDSLGRA